MAVHWKEHVRMWWQGCRLSRVLRAVHRYQMRLTTHRPGDCQLICSFCMMMLPQDCPINRLQDFMNYFLVLLMFLLHKTSTLGSLPHWFTGSRPERCVSHSSSDEMDSVRIWRGGEEALRGHVGSQGHRTKRFGVGSTTSAREKAW